VSSVDRLRTDSGTALVWFIALTFFIAMLALVLFSAIDQFLFARALTSFSEQFAVSAKTYALIEPNQSLELIGSRLWAQLENTRFWLDSVSLESGNTVKVVICGNWDSPLDLVSSSRKICEVALAR